MPNFSKRADVTSSTFSQADPYWLLTDVIGAALNRLYRSRFPTAVTPANLNRREKRRSTSIGRFSNIVLGSISAIFAVAVAPADGVRARPLAISAPLAT